MTDFSDKHEQERMQSYLNIHLKKDTQELSEEQQIEALHKKERNKWIMLAVNILAVLIFGYSFYYGITNLGQTFLIIILAVFGINVGLIFYQRKQIKELIDYLTWKKQRSL
ncbi:MAG TPA: hypothetical protein VK112_00495 [Fodinibius sp.]|nr:hypothetical protein [Fodinibius sp.]